MATTNGHKIMRKTIIVVRIERHETHSIETLHNDQRRHGTTRKNPRSKIKSHFDRPLDYDLKWAQTNTSRIVAISAADSGWVTWMTS